MSTLTTPEHPALLEIIEQLHSTLDLKRAMDGVAPLLQRLVGADHVAIAVSRPGTMYDYEWYNCTLPKSFLGNYAVIAERDFVRSAVARVPNRVLIDQQMITRQKYERHIVNQHARATGANLRRVMAVMLCHEQAWSSGLSLYRDRETPFTEQEASLLQRVVPHLTSAVRNSREHAALRRELWLEPVLEHVGLAVIWVKSDGREVARTPHATKVLEHHFLEHERPTNMLPDNLRDYAVDVISGAASALAPFVREGQVNSLRASVVALAELQLWALVLQPRGVDEQLAARLSPRLLTVAGCILRGLSNQEIADREQRTVATIKDQAEEIYRRLGVRGRKGLIQLASGLGTVEHPTLLPELLQEGPRDLR